MISFDDVPLNWRVIIPLTLHDDVKNHSFVGSLTSLLPAFAPSPPSGRAPGARKASGARARVARYCVLRLKARCVRLL
jgi:hypothetical protein